MSTVEVDKIIPATGTALQVGESGDTISIPTGASLTVTDEVKTNKISPATGTAFTLGDSGDTFTIPSGATITNSGTATGFGGGKIGQVVSVTKTDTASNTSTTFATVSGLSVSITPSSSSSKIYLIMSVSAGNSSGSAQYRFARGGTGIAIGDASSNRTQTTFSAGSEAGNRMYGFGSNFLDSPSTTSAITYSIQWRVQNSGTTIYINRSPDDSDNESHPRGTSTLTIMEVLA